MGTRTEDLMGGGLTPGAAIQILAINASTGAEAALADLLRDAGIAAHSHRAVQEEGLIAALEQTTLDIVLYYDGEEQIPLARAMALCGNYRPELPFILVYAEETPAILLAAMRQGVRDLVPLGSHLRLPLVILREYGDLCARRQLAALKQRLRESERRCHSLVEASRDAIAYLHEGMHIQANPAYLELFGYDRREALAGMPALDLVASTDQPRFKAQLRAFDQRTDSLSCELTCRHRDGHAFPARMELSPVHLQGEACLQLIVRAEKSVAGRDDARNTPADAPVDDADFATQLSEALAQQTLALAFQPIVSLRGDTHEHYAALAELPGGIRLRLDRFPPEARGHPQLAELDRRVIEQALARFARQRQQGDKINIFVPLSAASLRDEGLLLWICDCLRAAQAKGSCLTFQIDATDLHQHPQTATKLIDGLKKIKCQIAISGLDSATLDTPPLDLHGIDYVELGNPWLKDLTTSEAQRDRLRECSQQLQSLGIKSIATKVEDTDSLALLWNAGVHYIQGGVLSSGR